MGRYAQRNRRGGSPPAPTAAVTILDVTDVGGGVYEITFDHVVGVRVGATTDTRFDIDGSHPTAISLTSPTVVSITGIPAGGATWTILAAPQPIWLLSPIVAPQTGPVS